MRSGLPDREAVCPYRGMYNIVRMQFPDRVPDVLYDLITYQLDYKFGPYPGAQHPKPGKYYRDAPIQINDLTRLEDIDESWVEAYFRNMLTGIKINSGNYTLSDYRRHTAKKYLYEDSESGSLSDPSEYVAEEPDVSYTYVEKLPYLLKRLHERSKEVGIHLISLVIAYEKALKLALAVKSNSEDVSVQPKDIIAQGAFLMTREGKIGSRILNSHHKTQEYFAWIRGMGEHDEYFDNVIELCHIAEKIRVDLTKEDPSEYQEEFINSLVVTYITSNKDVGRRTNSEVLSGLRGLNLKQFNVKQRPNEVDRYEAAVKLKANQFLFSTAPDIELYRDPRNKHEDVKRFLAQLAGITKEAAYVTDSTILCDGFYMVDKFSYFTVNVSDICNVTSDKQKKCRLANYRALVHSSGFFILVTGDINMYYLDIGKAGEYLTDVFASTQREYKRYDNNTKFGTWEVARI